MVASEFHCATLSMSNVNADCDVEIIISWNKPPAVLNEVFIKEIQYNYFAPIITSAPIITAPVITSALIPSIKFLKTSFLKEHLWWLLVNKGTSWKSFDVRCDNSQGMQKNEQEMGRANFILGIWFLNFVDINIENMLTLTLRLQLPKLYVFEILQLTFWYFFPKMYVSLIYCNMPFCKFIRTFENN